MTLDLGCITKLDCGCKAYEVLGISASYIEIKLCPMHTAAPDMLEALKILVDTPAHDTEAIAEAWDKAYKAIAKAELPK